MGYVGSRVSHSIPHAPVCRALSPPRRHHRVISARDRGSFICAIAFIGFVVDPGYPHGRADRRAPWLGWREREVPIAKKMARIVYSGFPDKCRWRRLAPNNVNEAMIGGYRTRANSGDARLAAASSFAAATNGCPSSAIRFSVRRTSGPAILITPIAG